MIYHTGHIDTTITRSGSIDVMIMSLTPIDRMIYHPGHIDDTMGWKQAVDDTIMLIIVD